MNAVRYIIMMGDAHGKIGDMMWSHHIMFDDGVRSFLANEGYYLIHELRRRIRIVD